MAQVYEVPLSSTPQSFGVSLGGTSYQLTVVWREAVGGGWFIDFATPQGDPILQGLPMVTGADLLAQYRHLSFTGSLVVQTDGDLDAEPTFANLGSAAHLYYLP